jgi:hypothetical protein
VNAERRGRAESGRKAGFPGALFIRDAREATAHPHPSRLLLLTLYRRSWLASLFTAGLLAKAHRRPERLDFSPSLLRTLAKERERKRERKRERERERERKAKGSIPFTHLRNFLEIDFSSSASTPNASAAQLGLPKCRFGYSSI